MKQISSRENTLFKSLKKLRDSARERAKIGQTIMDGDHLLSAYLAAGGMPKMIVVSQSAVLRQEFEAILKCCPEVQKIEMTDVLFNEIASVNTPTGILSIISIPHIATPECIMFCLLLEDVQDPGNLGSILRSAAAANVSTVYLSPHCADVWSPKVLRAGMGAHFVLKIIEGVDLLNIATQFSGLLVATSLDADKTLYDLNLTGVLAFIIGNEGGGLSQELLSAAHERITIPMPGQVESLNAAAAAAVCLFERVRQVSLQQKNKPA